MKDKFIGTVRTEWLDDGRNMRLSQELIYVDPTGRQWKAPVGLIIDGATIPQAFWSVVGGPYEGPYRKASIIHDAACKRQTELWESVHLAFYNACLCCGTDQASAKVMYYAVYHFGPRWAAPTAIPTSAQKQAVPRLRMPSERQAEAVQSFVLGQDPSLTEIRQQNIHLVTATQSG